MLLLWITLTAIGGTTAALNGQDRTARVWYIDEHPIAPPDTWQARIAAATLVIRGRIDSKAVETTSQSGPFPDVQTHYAVQIMEVLRAGVTAPPVGSQISIYRVGGETTENGQVLKAINPAMPDLSVGDYVFFLQARITGGFSIMWGTNGVIDLSKNTISMLERSALSREANRTDREQFLEMLRAAAKQLP